MVSCFLSVTVDSNSFAQFPKKNVPPSFMMQMFSGDNISKKSFSYGTLSTEIECHRGHHLSIFQSVSNFPDQESYVLGQAESSKRYEEE